MSLPSLQLDAFLEVARTRNFSHAAKNLHVTQPALSQRILNLEQHLGAILLIREPSGIRLTDRGEQLLRYCQMRERLEEELLSRWRATEKDELGGTIRIGGFSTVMRSVVLPALGKLLLKNPAVQIEIKVHEMRHLPGLLRRGEIDYVVVDHEIERGDLRRHLLGYEENVLIEPEHLAPPASNFLDHDSEDPTTRDFLRLNKLDARGMRRLFLDEIYGILDGVALGLGRAVVPHHLIRDNPRVRKVKGHRSLRIPIVLHYYEQPFYSRLHDRVVESLTQNAPELLR